LSGFSPSYHDFLALQSPCLMRGRGVTEVCALLNCGFSRSEALYSDFNMAVFGAHSPRGVQFQITWLNYYISIKTGSNDQEKH
jgi:hypothetical protein